MVSNKKKCHIDDERLHYGCPFSPVFFFDFMRCVPCEVNFHLVVHLLVFRVFKYVITGVNFSERVVKVVLVYGNSDSPIPTINSLNSEHLLVIIETMIFNFRVILFSMISAADGIYEIHNIELT
jgi:hypothetical protein